MENLHVKQFIKFIMVGFINTGLYYILYLIFLHMGLFFAAAHTLATAIAVVNSYLWNKFFTFRSRAKSYKEAGRFLLICFVQYLCNLVALYVLIVIMGISEELAGLLAVGTGILVSFFGNKFYSFR